MLWTPVFQFQILINLLLFTITMTPALSGQTTWPLKQQHIALRKNSVRKWVQDKTISVKHVAGKINPADIFTKEMHDGVHFCCLWDSFMSWLSDFLNTSLLETHHARQQSKQLDALSMAWVALASSASSYFCALAINSFCQLVTAMSHLSNAGCQLLCGLYGFIPSGLKWCQCSATLID